ncbi:porin [Shimia sp. Alg240-R146]|uniref:porin n=1 Tax=Shimia sp. Alg240-R146 TaxID=2993449 RepID=UPI0022E7A7A7|nr:porin [Shimia sp. Alg240-R146]
MKRLVSFWLVLLGCATGSVAQEAGADGRGIFSIYGQINRGVLSYDDGLARDTYWFVDGSKSVSRIGATYDRDMRGGWRFRARGELALRWKETNQISQSDPHHSGYKFDRREIRKIEVEFKHDAYGTFSLGQGAMAADGFTGLDLSLTTVVAGAPVQDAAGGMILRPIGAAPNDLLIKQAFRTMGSSRRLRIRYDSPMLGGVRFAMAAGKEVLSEFNDSSYADISVRYDGDHGDYRLRGGAAFRWIEGSGRNKRDVLIASGSVLHRPSGWNLSMATGHEDGGGRYVYGKVGYIARWWKVGHTAFSIDIYEGNDIAKDVLGVSGGVSRSYGFAVVQRLKKQGVDLYALVRRYDDETPVPQYQASTAILVGARWRF